MAIWPYLVTQDFSFKPNLRMNTVAQKLKHIQQEIFKENKSHQITYAEYRLEVYDFTD